MVGIDIIEVSRVDCSDAFLKKIASEKEIEYIKKSASESLQRQRCAALFCVKEAVMKALGLGEKSRVSFKDIELFHQPSGKPCVKLYGVALATLEKDFAGKTIEISLSHIKDYATAIAVIN